jgi:hypothetical protein
MSTLASLEKSERLVRDVALFVLVALPVASARRQVCRGRAAAPEEVEAIRRV